VLVVEYGNAQETAGAYDPPPPTGLPSGDTFAFESLPLPHMNNRTVRVTVGKVAGGGSAVNGQFLDRGSRYDYDAWAAIGSPEFDNDENKWDWNGLLPYFKKVSR
jgi:choline dehydrogenase